ncbi:riboflavin synthase subunit alpha [Buchnera aphidicola]|uniref:riboflavin synthase subunit alpha n=1 Tax=Buchnera aphidicola TaxID=9 RepID=UPI0034648DFC
MFTGIVHGTANVVSIEKKKNFHSYTIKLSSLLSEGLKVGASVSNNGCCLTVKHIDKLYYTFDIMKETLNHTNLGILNIGDYINIERSAKYGDEIGGHIVSGHILNTAEVCRISEFSNNYTLWLKIHNKNIMKYFFYRGFICIDGISLTIGEIIENEFCIHIIPETLLRTTIKNKKKGSLMNIEIDVQTQIIVDTTERFINNQKKYLFKNIISH